MNDGISSNKGISYIGQHRRVKGKRDHSRALDMVLFLSKSH